MDASAINTLKNGKAAGLDDIRTEQIKHFGEVAQLWLLHLFDNCVFQSQLPKIWRKARVIAILKSGKDPNVAKSYRPISLLCHLYNLFERLILNRLGLITEQHLIPEQAGFCPGRSCTSQVLNLTQYIENGFEKNQPTGVVFVDLTAAYDTVSHRLILNKLYKMTSDIHLTKLATPRKQTFLCRAEWKAQQVEDTEKWSPSGQCSRSGSLQHIHKRPTCLTGFKELHLCR